MVVRLLSDTTKILKSIKGVIINEQETFWKHSQSDKKKDCKNKAIKRNKQARHKRETLWERKKKLNIKKNEEINS